MKPVTSSSNPSFRAWLRLATHPRAVADQGRSLAEGLHLAQAARASSLRVEAVLIRRGRRNADADRFAELFAAEGAFGFELAAELYDRLSPVVHGAGLMLVVPVTRWPRPARAAHDLLYLDGVQDPGNAGTLLRTAAAAGVSEVLAGPSTAALWAPKTLRAGQGAHFRLRLHEGVPAGLLPELLDGPWIGADARGGEPLWSAALPAGAVGWVFGGEGAGLSDAALDVCGQRVVIPVDSGVDSLNVGAAAAICLFERRRRLSTSP
jgi:TrmH family RNA methyltransferase